MAGLELVQKHARHRDIMDFLEPLVTLLLTDYTTDKQVQSLMSYLLQVGETNNLEALITSLASSVPKHEDTLMTIAEQLRQQGEQRGRQEGIQLGEAKALKEMARKMMLNGMDQQAIMDVTGLSADELTRLSH
ncbi:Rpn family recombination-promoting nuclease/putative transposase [Vibrio cyclitrophicus]|uniref:Rpn family recombination-promoting nuclease/putative transposase n=1 Tax=Vibrio cyclitrophicus TaxID=47951 RepID=A0ACD5G4I8_9VIBR|nr:Rpn family recombination-promoting nuclease/putative transposase [Vibrio cyclitrophicus]